MESRLMRNIEEEINVLKFDFAHESRNRIEALESLKNYLEVDIPKLQEALRAESIEREASEA